MIRSAICIQLNGVEQNDGPSYHNWLANFKAVNTGVNIYGISAKHSKHSHVQIIEKSYEKF